MSCGVGAAERRWGPCYVVVASVPMTTGHDYRFWEWVCTIRCPSVPCVTYSIDAFVRTFMFNSYRLLASGRVIALPEDAESITAVIRSLTEPCHVTLFYIAEGRFSENFLSECSSLASLDTSGLRALVAVARSFVDLTGITLAMLLLNWRLALYSFAVLPLMVCSGLRLIKSSTDGMTAWHYLLPDCFLRHLANK